MSTVSKINVPNYLLNDRYWRGTLYLLREHPKLQSIFTTKYFDLNEGNVAGEQLLLVAKPWSSSEKVMLNLALHLYNERYPFSMHDMTSLDQNNMRLALHAINLRFL